MEEQKNDKRTLSIEIDDEVKKVSITGMDNNEQVVMKQELNEEELAEATGGKSIGKPLLYRREREFNSSCRSFSCPFEDLAHLRI